MLLKNADFLTELHEKFINVKALRHNLLSGKDQDLGPDPGRNPVPLIAQLRNRICSSWTESL
jgi:hypothetical protein